MVAAALPVYGFESLLAVIVSGRYRLCCRTSNLNEVIDGCIAQHGENWLYPHIRAILRSLTRSVPVVSDIGNPQASVLTPQACISARGSCGGGSAKDDKSAGSEIADKSSKPNKILHQGVQGPHIRTVAIELRHKTSGKLVAGELGVIVGAIYMSLSGFYTTSGTGTIQLVALGAYLRSVGCHLWDFGMGMECTCNQTRVFCIVLINILHAMTVM